MTLARSSVLPGFVSSFRTDSHTLTSSPAAPVTNPGRSAVLISLTVSFTFTTDVDEGFEARAGEAVLQAIEIRLERRALDVRTGGDKAGPDDAVTQNAD